MRRTDTGSCNCSATTTAETTTHPGTNTATPSITRSRRPPTEEGCDSFHQTRACRRPSDNSVSRPRPRAGTRFGKAQAARIGPGGPDTGHNHGRRSEAREGAAPRSGAVEGLCIGLRISHAGRDPSFCYEDTWITPLPKGEENGSTPSIGLQLGCTAVMLHPVVSGPSPLAAPPAPPRPRPMVRMLRTVRRPRPVR